MIDSSETFSRSTKCDTIESFVEGQAIDSTHGGEISSSKKGKVVKRTLKLSSLPSAIHAYKQQHKKKRKECLYIKLIEILLFIKKKNTLTIFNVDLTPK